MLWNGTHSFPKWNIGIFWRHIRSLCLFSLTNSYCFVVFPIAILNDWLNGSFRKTDVDLKVVWRVKLNFSFLVKWLHVVISRVYYSNTLHFFVVQLLSPNQGFATPWTAAHQASLSVRHQLPELAQTHVHWVGDAMQPSHPLSSPSPPVLNLSLHQGLFQWVISSHQLFQWILRTDFL